MPELKLIDWCNSLQFQVTGSTGGPKDNKCASWSFGPIIVVGSDIGFGVGIPARSNNILLAVLIITATHVSA
jgi:hypothetical protein